MVRVLLPIIALVFGAPAQADGISVLGLSYVVTNDSIGEFRDRWQTSVVEGRVFLDVPAARDWALLSDPVVELRFTSQIVTPDRIDAPGPGDRPFAGVLAAGTYLHSTRGPAEVSAGLSLSAVGPQTGTFRFQRWLHEILGFPLPAPEDYEIGDGFHPGVTVEIGRTLPMPAGTVRPFAEARLGPEDILRAGIDVTLGALGRDDLMVRESVTGLRLPGLEGPDISGWSIVAGADAAYVAGSLYLPASRGFDPLPRYRLRGGVHWQTRAISAFYGVSWLSPEFDGQPDGQFVGAVQFRLRF